MRPLPSLCKLALRLWAPHAEGKTLASDFRFDYVLVVEAKHSCMQPEILAQEHLSERTSPSRTVQYYHQRSCGTVRSADEIIYVKEIRHSATFGTSHLRHTLYLPLVIEHCLLDQKTLSDLENRSHRWG